MSDGEVVARLRNYKRFFDSAVEAVLGPLLMTLGIAVALLSYDVGRATPLSVDLSMAALTLDILGAAMEFTFLLVLIYVKDLLTGRRPQAAIIAVEVALLMAAYVLVIGIPIVGYVESRVGKAFGVRGLASSGLLWVLSLLTGGLILCLSQLSLSAFLRGVISHSAAFSEPRQRLGDAP